MLSGDADAAGLGSLLWVIPGDIGGLHIKTTEGETTCPSYRSRINRAADKAGLLAAEAGALPLGHPACLLTLSPSILQPREPQQLGEGTRMATRGT